MATQAKNETHDEEQAIAEALRDLEELKELVKEAEKDITKKHSWSQM